MQVEAHATRKVHVHRHAAGAIALFKLLLLLTPVQTSPGAEAMKACANGCVSLAVVRPPYKNGCLLTPHVWCPATAVCRQ